MKVKICVYCGAQMPHDPVYAEATRETGRLIGAGGYDMVYGGERIGLMGLVADAALAAGAAVTGIIPHQIREREIQHEGLTELVVVDSMDTRKQMMVSHADAFLVLPGGFGTLDETFGILTWKRLGLHEAKPVVFLNVRGYWTSLLQVIEHQITAGFVREDLRHAFAVADAPSAALSLIASAVRAR